MALYQVLLYRELLRQNIEQPEPNGQGASSPELRGGLRVHEHQLTVLGRQVVVHHHVHPLAVLPEPVGQR